MEWVAANPTSVKVLFECTVGPLVIQGFEAHFSPQAPATVYGTQQYMCTSARDSAPTNCNVWLILNHGDMMTRIGKKIRSKEAHYSCAAEPVPPPYPGSKIAV